MNKTLCLLGLAAGLATASAETYDFAWNSGFENNAFVPDGDLTGWSDTRAVSGLLGQVTDVNVSLQLVNGWNGDLYAYLVHGDSLAILLNRPGVGPGDPWGFGDAGFNIVLDDSAALGDIHRYAFQSGYAPLIQDGSAWAPDGRFISPLSVSTLTPRTQLLNVFNGEDGNGDWTLFIADASTGETTEVSSWGMTIVTDGVEIFPEIIDETNAVPEVATPTGLAALIAAVWAARRARRAR